MKILIYLQNVVLVATEYVENNDKGRCFYKCFTFEALSVRHVVYVPLLNNGSRPRPRPSRNP
jgi:hypothetical protein